MQCTVHVYKLHGDGKVVSVFLVTSLSLREKRGKFDMYVWDLFFFRCMDSHGAHACCFLCAGVFQVQ